MGTGPRWGPTVMRGIGPITIGAGGGGGMCMGECACGGPGSGMPETGPCAFCGAREGEVGGNWDMLEPGAGTLPG